MNIKNTIAVVIFTTLFTMSCSDSNEIVQEQNENNNQIGNTNIPNAPYQYPNDRLYSSSHEWIQIDENGVGKVGVTQEAIGDFGDVVSITGPIGSDEIWIKKPRKPKKLINSSFAEHEVEVPASGNWLGTNPLVEANPSLVSSDPLNAGWIFRLTNLDQIELSLLMTSTQYMAFISNQ